ncbi:hypothetical protein D3C83_182900 [compost metagenome]
MVEFTSGAASRCTKWPASGIISTVVSFDAWSQVSLWPMESSAVSCMPWITISGTLILGKVGGGAFFGGALFPTG